MQEESKIIRYNTEHERPIRYNSEIKKPKKDVKVANSHKLINRISNSLKFSSNKEPKVEKEKESVMYGNYSHFDACPSQPDISVDICLDFNTPKDMVFDSSG